MTMSSLRTRLFLGMAVTIFVTAAIGGWFAYRWAYNEAIEMQDSVLLQIGSFVTSGSVSAVATIHGVDAESEITVLELPRAPCAPSDACRMAALADGLHLAVLQGQPIRAYLTTAPNDRRFAVTQRTTLRDEIGTDFAVRSLLPVAILIPCLMLMTAFVIAKSLRPVIQLAQELDLRRPDDMTPLAAGSLPREIAPFVASINGLLGRVSQMMVRERRFIAEAAHELRSPITAISLQVENVGKVELPDLARSRVAILEQGVRRVRHLLEQLMSLARQDVKPSAAYPVVDLASITKDVTAGLLVSAAQKDIDVGFAMLETVHVRADPFELSTLVRNLIDNAIRFSPPGGRVDIDVHPAGALAVLQVADTGPGAPAQDLARLFEPFYRGETPVEDGTGLGLAIVKRIVTNLGGSIDLQNRKSGGATGLYVTVRLPSADHAAYDLQRSLAVMCPEAVRRAVPVHRP